MNRDVYKNNFTDIKPNAFHPHSSMWQQNVPVLLSVCSSGFVYPSPQAEASTRRKKHVMAIRCNGLLEEKVLMQKKKWAILAAYFGS